MGGAKISTKLGVVRSFLERVDSLLVGGGIAYTLLASLGKTVGASIHEPDYTEYAKDLLLRYADKIKASTLILHGANDNLGNSLVQAINLATKIDEAGAPGGSCPAARACGRCSCAG